MVQASLLFFQSINEWLTSIFKCRHSYTVTRYTTRFSPLLNFKVRTELFRNSFFPCNVTEWNNLDNIIKSSKLYLMFRKRMLNLVTPKCHETYVIHSPTGLNSLTYLRLGLSHLNDHKFNNNFRDCINPLCSCSL